MPIVPPMNSVRRLRAVLWTVVAGFLAQAAPKSPYLHPPAVEEFARHDPLGTTILSNGRFLTPAGHAYPIHSWPHGMAITRDGRSVQPVAEGTMRSG